MTLDVPPSLGSGLDPGDQLKVHSALQAALDKSDPEIRKRLLEAVNLLAGVRVKCQRCNHWSY